MTPAREFGAAIGACAAGAGLVLASARQDWARAFLSAPAPLPSASVQVSGQQLMPALSALALAALACLAAVIATRGLARRVAGLAMAALGGWTALLAAQPVRAAAVATAVSGQAVPGISSGNSTISGGRAGGGLPAIGTITRVTLAGVPWRQAAVIGAAAVIAAGLLAAWRGPRWAVMSARFDPGVPAAPAAADLPAGPARGPAAGLREGPPACADGAGGITDQAELWEALDQGVDLTRRPDAGAAAVAEPRPEPGGEAGG